MKVALALASIALTLQCAVTHAKPLNETRGRAPWKAQTPAQPCDESKCQPPSCRCASTTIPGSLQAKNTPQIVMFSFDDALRDQDHKSFYQPIFQGRKNPNGCPIGLTYFVSHNYTDYSLVEHVYRTEGAEIEDHSVTHRSPTTWWEDASEEEWSHEIMDQKEILSLWGGVGASEIRGFRSPFLATSETELKVLHEKDFLYEASMVTRTNYWPFTLDYKSPICDSPATCPVNAYPGLWLVPNVVYNQSSGFPCSMLDGCTAPVTEANWLEFFDENFRVHYDDNRSPFGIYSHSAWFYGVQAKERYDAMSKFLDKLAAMEDVYIVTHSQMLEWVRHPTALDKIREFEPWKCPSRPPPRCSTDEPNCHKVYDSEETLKTCTSPCPPNYPGYDNPEGK